MSNRVKHGRTRPVLICLALLLTLPLSSLAETAPFAAVSQEDWADSTVILDDPALFTDGGTDEPLPPVTSVGRQNVTVRGVRSKNKLVPYTVNDAYMSADTLFAALMTEAGKYIGYPYAEGMANPKDGFDCSGFVSWVFIHSGVYNTGRRGANGLYSLCREISPESALPGDLVFFEGTMGPDVKGITHVGIYVGDGWMIHAGDPVGFADLGSGDWPERFKCFGRLPYRKE